MSIDSAFMRIPVALDPPYPNPEVEEEPAVEVNEHSAIGLLELLLKKPARIEAVARDESRQWELLPRFLAIALAIDCQEAKARGHGRSEAAQ